MKICFVSLKNYPLFNPKYKGNFGGAETQLYYLSTKLAQDPKYSVSTIVYDVGQPDVEVIQNVLLYKYKEKHNILDKIKYIRYIAKIFRLFIVFKRVNANIYIQRCKNDLTIYTAFFCKLLNKKFVFMVASEMDVMGKILKDIPIFNNLFHNYGLTNSHLIISQNISQQQLIKKNYRLKSYVQKSVYPITKNENVNREHILWVGRSVPVKQPEVLFELARNNPGKKFIMICKCVPFEIEFFESTKTTAQGIKNIQFIEHVPFNEIELYFQKAKLLCNTSIYEGFPNTFIEAWKNGTPVVSLNIDPDNIITTHSLGFCSRSIVQMNNDLNRILFNEKLYKKMSDSAYLYVKENHNIEVIIEEFKNHLHSLVVRGV